MKRADRCRVDECGCHDYDGYVTDLCLCGHSSESHGLIVRSGKLLARVENDGPATSNKTTEVG